MKSSYHTIMKCFYYLILLFCLSFPKCILAQYPGQNMHHIILDRLGQIASPQATDLGRFGDIPMSHYTGRANITIPIHSFTERGITLDINLSYDTAGPMMNQLPGWVGPSWTLNAGGCITRVQNGLHDEVSFDNRLDLVIFKNYFESYSDFIQEGELNANAISNFPDYLKHDYSADLFYFNFMGKTGHFFLGNDGNWKVSSDDNLVVVFDISNNSNYTPPVFPYSAGTVNGTGYTNDRYEQSRAIKGFIIYDDNGNKYTFGYTAEAIEYSIDLFKTSDHDVSSTWVATNWFLTKVEDRFGNELFRLNYRRGKFIVQLYQSSYSENIMTTSPNLTWHSNLTEDHSSWATGSYSGTLNSPCYLTHISSLGGNSVYFHFGQAYPDDTASRNLYPSLYSNGSPKNIYPFNPPSYTQFYFSYLQSLEYSQYWSTPTDKRNDPLSAMDLQFLYGISVKLGSSTDSVYYQLNYDTNGRKHLSNVQIKTPTVRIGTYDLTYYAYDNIPSDYMTERHDAWGYFRQNASSNGLLNFISQDGDLIVLGEDNTLPDNIPFNAAGLLKEIVYPTGGKTTLEYEQNDYSQKRSNDRLSMIQGMGKAGGARVKSITDYSGAFGSPNKRREFSYKDSSGNSSGQLFSTPTYYWFWKASNIHLQSMFISVCQSIPMLPLFTSSGICVGYSDIKETLSDGSSISYHYSNFSEIKDEPAVASYGLPTIECPYSRYGNLNFMRGKILSETIKDASGSVFSKKEFQYRSDSLSFMNTFYSYSSYIRPLGGNVNFPIGSIYKLYHPKYDIEKIISTTRHGNKYVIDTITYEKDEYQSIQNVPVYFRKCVSERTKRGSGSIEKRFIYHPTYTNPYFLPLSSTVTYQDGIYQNNDRTVYGLINEKWQPVMETRCVTSGVTDTLLTYNEYTSSGQPFAYTKKGEYETLLFWGDNDKLLASITSPFTRSQLQLNTSATSPLDVLKMNGQSVFNYPDVRGTVFSYNNKGLLSATATQNGIVRYYYYDVLGRLTSICDEQGRTLQQFSYHYSTGENNILGQ